jgi:hypothetical protein
MGQFERKFLMSGSTRTYSGDPLGNPKDRVRFLIGDTDMENPRAYDPEIQFRLSLHPNPWLAGALVAESLAARRADEINNSIGELREEARARQEKYERLAAMLRGDDGVSGRAGTTTGGGTIPANLPLPWAGGLDIPRAFDFTAERLADGRYRDTGLYAPGTQTPSNVPTKWPWEI